MTRPCLPLRAPSIRTVTLQIHMALLFQRKNVRLRAVKLPMRLVAVAASVQEVFLHRTDLWLWQRSWFGRLM